MVSVTVPVGLLCFVLFASAVSPQPTFLLPQPRNEEISLDVLESLPSGPVEYHQVLQNGDFAIAAAEPTELSLLDYVLSPITGVISLCSTALSVISWVVINGGLIFLGMAIVIGFCALTPYCTMTIEKPSLFARENISEYPYIEELETYFNEAYNKFSKLQDSF